MLALPGAAWAALLRSSSSDKPCTLTFFNKTERNIKLYWVNYESDQEFFAVLPPQGEYTVDSFATHPWRAVDADSGEVVQNYVAKEGFQLVPIQEEADSGVAASSPRERLPYSGWDGLGAAPEDYAPATLAEVSVGLEGGIASLQIEGFREPLGISIGLPEAAALLYASGLESRRPSTLKTWLESLDVAGANIERVVLTRLVGRTFYSRIVLSMGQGKLASIDSRPSDSLALALQSNKPVFVSKRIARENEDEVTKLLKMHPSLDPSDLIEGDEQLLQDV